MTTHYYTRRSFTSIKAQIESLWAAGKTGHQIAAELGCGIDYTQQVVRLILAHSKTEGSSGYDNGKHLEIIAERRFPVMHSRPGCRVPA